MRKQRGVFEVTRRKVWFTLLIAALALTAVFELGISMGKRRAIRERQEMEQQSSAKMRIATKASTEVKLPRKTPSDQPIEQPEPEQTKARYTIQVSTFRLRENAEEMVNLLKSYEYKSWMRSELHGEEMLYSVLVGSFNTKEEAEQFGRAISERLTYITGYMVREMKEEDAEPGTHDKISDDES